MLLWVRSPYVLSNDVRTRKLRMNEKLPPVLKDMVGRDLSREIMLQSEIILGRHTTMISIIACFRPHLTLMEHLKLNIIFP